MTPQQIEVVQLGAEQTHAIRRSVLRAGDATATVVFEGDDHPDTVHLGATVGGELVAISSWMPRRYPDLPAHEGRQLRGMASIPAVRGSGIGAQLLHAGVERAAGSGSTVVWARARATAVAFYERHGFETRGVEYVDLTTGLPHRDIVKMV